MTDGLENLALTQAELASCQPRPGEGGRALRAFCPFHGSDKQRSLRVELKSGRFQCFSCGAWGYTTESRERFKEERNRERQYTQDDIMDPSRQTRKVRHSPKIRKPKPVEPSRPDLVELLHRYQEALPGSWGEEYLSRRGILMSIAESVGVGYAPRGRWAHRSRDWRFGRLVFPHTTPSGVLVNLYGRAVGSDEKVPKAQRHDHLPGAKGYFNAEALRTGSGAVFVCEGPFDAISLLAAGCERVVAIYGVHGWRDEWLKGTGELVFALDADRAGERWRELAKGALLRGKKVYSLPSEAYGGKQDVAEAWAEGVLSLKAFGTDD